MGAAMAFVARVRGAARVVVVGLVLGARVERVAVAGAGGEGAGGAELVPDVGAVGAAGSARSKGGCPQEAK